MEYDTKDFFVENESNEVRGFIIIETDPTEGYRIAEKWMPSDDARDDTWLTYWISEEALAERVEAGKCEKAKEVTDKQFTGVLNLAGVADQVAEASKASA